MCGGIGGCTGGRYIGGRGGRGGGGCRGVQDGWRVGCLVVL